MCFHTATDYLLGKSGTTLTTSDRISNNNSPIIRELHVNSAPKLAPTYALGRVVAKGTRMMICERAVLQEGHRALQFKTMTSNKAKAFK